MAGPVQVRWPPEAEVWVPGDATFRAGPWTHGLQAQGWHGALRCPGHIRVRTEEGAWVTIPDLTRQRGETQAISACS